MQPNAPEPTKRLTQLPSSYTATAQTRSSSRDLKARWTASHISWRGSIRPYSITTGSCPANRYASSFRQTVNRYVPRGKRKHRHRRERARKQHRRPHRRRRALRQRRPIQRQGRRPQRSRRGLRARWRLSTRDRSATWYRSPRRIRAGQRR